LASTLDEMLEDYWLHAYYDDPKAVTETVEDDEFDESMVAEMLQDYRRPPDAADALPDDFEPLL